MAPIIVARSVSQDSTESSSVHLKTNDIAVGSSTTRALCSPPSTIKENETSREDKIDNQSAEEPAKNSDSNKLAHQSSNLFVDEDELLQCDTNESFVSRGQLSIDTEYQNHADGSMMQTSSSRKERFGIFSPSGSGELEEVSLSTTSPLSDNPTHLSNLETAFNYSLNINGFDQRQINADEELARSLQAEEDKKQQRRKPKRGSTLECWFEDSIHQLGKRINETAVDFFGGK
jgi:hypothetical protein